MATLETERRIQGEFSGGSYVLLLTVEGNLGNFGLAADDIMGSAVTRHHAKVLPQLSPMIESCELPVEPLVIPTSLDIDDIRASFSLSLTLDGIVDEQRVRSLVRDELLTNVAADIVSAIELALVTARKQRMKPFVMSIKPGETRLGDRLREEAASRGHHVPEKLVDELNELSRHGMGLLRGDLFGRGVDLEGLFAGDGFSDSGAHLFDLLGWEIGDRTPFGFGGLFAGDHGFGRARH